MLIIVRTLTDSDILINDTKDIKSDKLNTQLILKSDILFQNYSHFTEFNYYCVFTYHKQPSMICTDSREIFSMLAWKHALKFVLSLSADFIINNFTPGQEMEIIIILDRD